MPNDPIRTVAVPACPVCRGQGQTVYEQLIDRVFGAPGEWQISQCENAHCSLLWLNPCPAPTDMHRAYASYYTHAPDPGQDGRATVANIRRQVFAAVREQYVGRRFGYELSERRPLLGALAHLHPAGVDALAVDVMFLESPPAGGRLLEIGCGDGRLLGRMRARGWQVEGVEYDPSCVGQVRSLGIECHHGDIRQLALAGSAYNAIYMGNVIEHIYEPREFLRECFRILKPGGSVVMLTPNAESWGRRHFQEDWRGLEPPRHLQIFNLRNLRKLCEASDFTVACARTSNRGAWYILGTSAKIREARKRGRQMVEPTSPPLSVQGAVYTALGRLIAFANPKEGEELLFIACKP